MKEEKIDRVVTLATFTTAAEAEIAASMLGSMGIHVEVANEIAAAVLPYFTDNSVKLLVAESDYAKALELLSAEQVKD